LVADDGNQIKTGQGQNQIEGLTVVGRIEETNYFLKKILGRRNKQNGKARDDEKCRPKISRGAAGDGDTGNARPENEKPGEERGQNRDRAAEKQYFSRDGGFLPEMYLLEHA